MAILFFLLPLAILALLGVAALRWGVDSRSETSDPRGPQTPIGLQAR